jgi:HK97 family phage prohead protease
MTAEMGHASWLQRCWNFKLLEQSAEAATGTFSGYLAAYGNTDENEDRLMPGAFTASLAEYRRAGEMPPMFLNHAGIPWDAVTTESLLPIGVWTDITEDSRGLASKGRIDPMDTDLGKRIYAGLRNRTVKGLSIGYKAIGFTRGKAAAEPRRTITEAKLFEGSIICMPANPLASIDRVTSATRGLLDRARGRLVPEEFDPRNIRHLDTLLRDAGLSRSKAKGVLALGFKNLATPRDAGAAGALDALLTEIRSAKSAVAR